MIARSSVADGLAVVFSRHTTAAITLNELEPLLLEDMAEFLDRVAPRAHAYRHNDFSVRTVNMTPDESPNGHAHCLQLMLGASQTIVPPLIGQAIFRDQVEMSGTVRGRLGYAFGDWLLYATGGFAYSFDHLPQALLP